MCIISIGAVVRFNNSICGACFTMMALFGAGPICFGSIAQHGKSEFVFFLGAQGMVRQLRRDGDDLRRKVLKLRQSNFLRSTGFNQRNRRLCQWQ
jgi:hypothetical protein